MDGYLEGRAITKSKIGGKPWRLSAPQARGVFRIGGTHRNPQGLAIIVRVS
jgi:hypothetical protein